MYQIIFDNFFLNLQKRPKKYSLITLGTFFGETKSSTENTPAR